MSVYPQSRSYGQYPPAHNVYHNHPPPPPPHYYQYVQPSQQPQYFADPNAFRREYTGRLAELTVNSRPIIQSLSMLAQDYSRWAEIVAQCVESHIRRVPPWIKLPAFYLLDAVSKNVFDPYARYFSPIIVPLFLEAYAQVEPSIKSKMEEMLLTWRTGAPGGRELFGVAAQLAIEQGIWPTSTSSSHESSGISRSQVLSELEFTVSQKERAIQANPYDSQSSSQLSVLYQLRKIVEAGVSQEELRQISGQLRTLSRSNPVPNTSSAGPPAPPQVHVRDSYPHSQTNYVAPATSHPVSAFHASAPQSQPVVPMLPVGDITNLFSALVKAGVVSATPTPPSTNPSVKPDQPNYDPVRESEREYRRKIMSQKVKLSTAEISKGRTDIVNLLYGRLGSQCKQCGLRFHDNAVGKKKLEDHLDMHFRQNRKANQNIGRGHNRSWFTALDDWIHDAKDVKGKRKAGSDTAEEIAKKDAELRAQYVVVPSGDESKAVTCPVCKEVLKSEFEEEEEEWVWRNAARIDDKVYHATCHAEAVSSTNTLAARLRLELDANQRSRSGTPSSDILARTSSLSPGPDSRLGKRKAEDTDDAKPTKRLELATST